MKYVINRVVVCLLSLFLIASIVFLLVRVIPGDSFVNVQRTDEAVIHAMKEHYDLDKPLGIQYIHFLNRLVHFDLGISSAYQGKSVNVIIRENAPVSFRISILSTLIGSVLGIGLAILSVKHEGKWMDYLCRGIMVFGIAASILVIAPLLQLVFGVWLQWLPIALISTPKHYILPVLSFSIVTMSLIAFVGRNEMLRVQKTDYVLVARAKGFSETRVFFCYVLRNSSIPMINMAAICFATNTVGSFFIESVYNIPGIGKVMMLAVNSLDYGLIMGLTIFFGILFILTIAVVDLLFVMIDPRIKMRTE